MSFNRGGEGPGGSPGVPLSFSRTKDTTELGAPPLQDPPDPDPRSALTITGPCSSDRPSLPPEPNHSNSSNNSQVVARSGGEESTEGPDENEQEVSSPCARFPLTDILEEEEQHNEDPPSSEDEQHKEDVEPTCAHNNKKLRSATAPFASSAAASQHASSVPSFDWVAAAKADQVSAQEQWKSLNATHGTAADSPKKKRAFDLHCSSSKSNDNNDDINNNNNTESDLPKKMRVLNSSSSSSSNNNNNDIVQQQTTFGGGLQPHLPPGAAPVNPTPATLSTPAKASPPEEPNPMQSPPWLTTKETPKSLRKTSSSSSSSSRKMEFPPHVWGEFFRGVFADEWRQENPTAGTPSFDALADREDGKFPSKIVKPSLFKKIEDNHRVGKKLTKYNSIRGADKYTVAFGTSPFGFTVASSSGGIEYAMPTSTMALGFVAGQVSRGLVADLIKNKSGGIVRATFLKTLLQKTRMYLPADHLICDTSFLAMVEKRFRCDFISRVAKHINKGFKDDGSALQTGYTNEAFEKKFVFESVKAVFGIRWKVFIENSSCRQSFIKDVKVQLRTILLKAVVSGLIESSKTKAWGTTIDPRCVDEDLTSLMDYHHDFLTPFNQMLEGGGCDCYTLNIYGFFGGGDRDKALSIFAAAASLTWKEELADLVARRSVLLEWGNNEGHPNNALAMMGCNKDAAQRISQNKEFLTLFELKKKDFDGPGGAAHLQYLENHGKQNNSDLVVAKQESQLARVEGVVATQESQLAAVEGPPEGYIHSSAVRVMLADQHARHTEQLTKVEHIHADSLTKKDATVIRNRELDMENKKLDLEREKVATQQRLASEKMMHEREKVATQQRLASEKMMHDSAQKSEDRWAKLVFDIKNPGAQLQSPAPASLGHSNNFAGPDMQSPTPSSYHHSTLQLRNLSHDTVAGFGVHHQPGTGAPPAIPAPTQPGGFAFHHQPAPPAQTPNGSFWSAQPSAGACTSATANMLGSQPSTFGATQHSSGAFIFDATNHTFGSNPAPEASQQSSGAFTFRALESNTSAHGVSQQSPGAFTFGATNHTFGSNTSASGVDDPNDMEQS